MPTTRFDVDATAMAALVAGEPCYRVSQLRQGLLAGHEPIDITTLPRALRLRLAAEPVLRAGLDEVGRRVGDGGATVKWLWRLADGPLVETVLMHYRSRSTVCVSSQAGCAMACGFCATGQGGFARHLTTGEIVEQVVRARSEADSTGHRVANVVFMGMGEPLANYDRVWAAVERLHADLGMSARHLTLSTVGVVPGIERLATETLPVNLAVSLHAANDTLRDELVPLNRRYPLARLAAACRVYLAAKNRRLSLEWAMIDGVNDRPGDAAELAAYARALGAHVNLIPLNPTPGYATSGTPPRRVGEFRARLENLAVNATVRRTRGTDIDAACGQLRASHAPAQPSRLTAPAAAPVRLLAH